MGNERLTDLLLVVNDTNDRSILIKLNTDVTAIKLVCRNE